VPTVNLPEEIRTGTVDENGLIKWYKDKESVLPYVFKWDYVLEGDTILTSEWEVEMGNLSITANSMTLRTTSITLASTDGIVKNTITTERGYTHIRRARFVSRDT
jgi:hypothetical protein